MPSPIGPPTENVAIERMRGIAASGAGDIPTATRSFEMVLASGSLAPAERTKMIEVLAQLYFQAKDYPKAASWASRYVSEGGPNPDMRWLMIRSQYLAGDCASAARELRPLVDADAKADGPPAQERLQILANCYAKLGDDAGYAFALDKLLACYPKKEYWADAIRRVESKPGFSNRNALDVLRLRHATGTLDGSASYAAMTKLAHGGGPSGRGEAHLRRGIRFRRARLGRRRGCAEATARRGGEAGDRRPEAAPAKCQGRDARRATASLSSTSASRT